MLECCLPACGGSYVPSDYVDLTREEVKKLYNECIHLNSGRLIVHGLFARADSENVNKRIYPKDLLQREVNRFKQNLIKNGTAVGEMEHPSYSSLFYKCINLPNISHQILDLTWKGSELWGSIEVLPTPAGLLVWELYSRGVKLGVSSRGWATLRTDPTTRKVYVDKDYELITFDFVVEPSTRDAYVVPIRKRFRKEVAEQQKLVGIAHLGFGAVSQKMIGRLPEARTLAQRVCEIRAAAAPAANGSQRQVASNPLDNVLLYSHYLVHTGDAFLQREQHQRTFQHHLALIATKALVANTPRRSGPHVPAAPSQRSSSSIVSPTSPSKRIHAEHVGHSASMNVQLQPLSHAAAAVAASANAVGATGEPLFKKSTTDGSSGWEEGMVGPLAKAGSAREEIAAEVKSTLEAYLVRLQQVRAHLARMSQ